MADTTKIIKGVVSNGRYTVTAPIVKEDYGLYLQIEGVELPETYQVDFSNSENSGTSVTMIGNADGVLIPHQFISTGKDVFAFLYHVGEDFGRTVYKFRIPNKLRPDRTDDTPTPEEQSTIDQTIAALNDAVESAQDAQQAIEDMSVSAQTLAEGSSATVTKSEQDGVVHLAFGIPRGATGAQGEQGEPGESGLTIVMQTSSYVIPTGTDGVLTENVRLSAVFRAYQGDTPLMGVVKSADKIIMDDPNNPDDPLRCAWATGMFPSYDITTNVRLLSGYKMHDGDNGTFRITITVDGNDYILNPTWALAKRGEQGEQGEPGESGYSPTASVGKSGKTTTITITDKNGTTSAQVEDGTDGTDGISPTVTITPITGGHRITITDADGSHSADVMDGTGSVDDVQINGTSIVENGVANVQTAGVSDTKTGTAISKPVTPNIQDASVFYGLAKSAGDATQSQSSNAVGEYTDSAKVAIQKMLGIYEAPWELIREDTFTNAEEVNHIIDTDANGETFELTDVVLLFETPKQATVSSKGQYGDITFSNNGIAITQVECGAWTQNANDPAHGVTIMIKQEGNMLITTASAQATNSNNGALRWRYGATFDSNVQAVRYLQTRVAITSIVIIKVLGTGHYRLYGRRKWQ